MKQHLLFWLGATALIVLAWPATGVAQKVKVFQMITTDHLEATLKDLGIKYKKAPGLPPVGGFDYNFVRNNLAMRIHYFNGSDLWIDAPFAKIAPDDINQWNRQARLSRAVLISGGFFVTSSLEAQLPCAGGVTEGMIRQFITNFEKEVQNFSTFVRTRVQEEEEIKSVSAEHLEKLLRGFNLEFKKTSGDDKEQRFEFTMNQHKMRLTCHEGNVLLLRSTYAKMPLDKINQYNVNRRYVRALVEAGADGKEVTVLEAYLDCRGGVTESILRSFLIRFGEELKEMDRFSSV
jgi:Putative bacterial sensory transduction regulator